MSTVLGICSALVTVAGKQLALYVTISTSGCWWHLQQRDCHGIDAVWTRRAARDCSGVDAKGVKHVILFYAAVNSDESGRTVLNNGLTFTEQS